MRKYLLLCLIILWSGTAFAFPPVIPGGSSTTLTDSTSTTSSTTAASATAVKAAYDRASACQPTELAPATTTLTAAQLASCNATSVHNYGQGAANLNITLPATAANLGFLATVSEAQAANYWRFTAASAGTIYLNGSATGKNYVEYTTPAVGSYFSCFTANVGNAYKWYCADGVSALATN